MSLEVPFSVLLPHWKVTTVGDVCALGGGNIQTGPFGSQLHAADYVPVGIPSIMPQNIGDNRVVPDGIARITEQDARRLGRYLVKPGDIVYSRRGDVERRALITENEDGWLCGTGCLRVRFGSFEYVDLQYASFYLGHPAIREWIVRHAIGATMPNLNTSILSALPFVLPPLSEQRAIADVLGSLDDKIELNRRMNQTLEALTRTLFKSWFVDFDPVRAKMEGRAPVGMDAETAAMFPSAFDGDVPDEWKNFFFSDILSHSTDRIGKEIAPEYSATVIGLSLRDDKFKKSLSRSNDKNKKIVKNDLVFGLSRQTLNFGVMKEDVGSVSPVYEIFRVDENVYIPELLELYIRMNMEEYVGILKPGAREGQAIDRRYLLSKKLFVPHMMLQKAYRDFCQPFLKQIEANEKQIRTLSTLRDALLPRLMNGEVRVKEVREDV